MDENGGGPGRFVGASRCAYFRSRMWGWLRETDYETQLKIASVLVGFVAAIFWLASSLVPLPLAPGAAVGGTLPTDPFNVALRDAGWWNRWAALLTAVAVCLTALAEVLGLRHRAKGS
jgi:uncharacterized membrane protein